MRGRPMIDSWEDLRCFLAVAETGSLSAAARRLHISQPTMGRRIKALERQLAARVFSPTAEGYVLTPLGVRLHDIAQQMERSVLSIERQVSGAEEDLAGRVRIATTECIAVSWLVDQVPALYRRYPRIEIEIVTGIKLRNLFRRETDLALRVGKPGSEKLVGQRLGEVTFGLYGAERYFAQHGRPSCLAELPNQVFVESAGDLANLVQVRLLRQLASGAAAPIRCNHLLTQVRLARTGVGLIAMPKYLTGIAPELHRLLADQFETRLDLWLLTHRDLRDAAPIRAVREYLSESVRRDRCRFTD